MRHALVFNIISLITFLLAVFFLATKGLHLSIEFTGGTLMEVSYAQAPDLQQIRKQLEGDGFADPQVQNFRLLARRADPRAAGARTTREPARSASGHGLAGKSRRWRRHGAAAAPELKRVEFVGPQVGKELAEDGALALLLVIVGIMLYLAMRFEWRFAVSAIIANLHDVVIILGFFSFFQWEFSLPVLAAVLAVLGYSVNESVVVFDRVRETFKKKRGLTTRRCSTTRLPAPFRAPSSPTARRR
jgi:preprotein translocase subunit SecF